MSIESIMWLFPIVFMIHEFEEIIFLPRWMKKNSIELHKKIPHIAKKMVLRLEDLSTVAFAVAAVGTGLFTGVYSIFSLYYLHLLRLLNWNQIIFLLPIVILIIAVNLIFCHSIARRMETRWKA